MKSKHSRHYQGFNGQEKCMPVEITSHVGDKPSKNATHFHLPFLDGLRGAAALYVVCHHFLAWSSLGVTPVFKWAISWSSYGHFAVCIFIVLSGFSLMLPVVNTSECIIRGGVVDYLKRRSKRILPAYFGSFLLSIGVFFLTNHFFFGEKNNPSIEDILAHVFLVHNLNPDWAGSINMAHWSIATEWQIYFLFPFLFLPAWRLSVWLCVFVALAVGILPVMLFPAPWNFASACPWFTVLFVFGMIIADLHVRRNIAPRLWVVIGGSLSVIYLVMKVKLGGDDYAWVRDCVGGGIAACFLGWGAGTYPKHCMSSTPVVRLLQSRALVGLGAFSYSLYLTHCIVLDVMLGGFRSMQMDPDYALVIRAVVGIPLSVAFAYVFHAYFERPFLSRKQK